MGRSFAYAAVGFQTRQDRESVWRDASGDGERANRLRAGRRHDLRETTAKVQRREVEGRAGLKRRGFAAWAKSEMEDDCGAKSEKPRDAASQVVDFVDGPCWARTSDPLIKSQLLYQLS